MGRSELVVCCMAPTRSQLVCDFIVHTVQRSAKVGGHCPDECGVCGRCTACRLVKPALKWKHEKASSCLLRKCSTNVLVKALTSSSDSTKVVMLKGTSRRDDPEPLVYAHRPMEAGSRVSIGATATITNWSCHLQTTGTGQGFETMCLQQP